VKPRPEERALPGESKYLATLMIKPVAKASPATIESIEAGPFEPELALAFAEADRMCDPAPLEVESGWTVLTDGSVQVAVETPMPDLTAEMVEWWFDWHPRRRDRYRVWHPVAHYDNGIVPAEPPGHKPFWGSVNFPNEDVGDGPISVRIDFKSPREFGFADDYLEDPSVGTIVCGRVGDRWLTHTDMAHVYLRDGDGLRLRSRFWIGERIRPRLPGPASVAEGRIGSLLSRSLVRGPAIPDGVGPGLARHCAEEYANLNSILPGLFDRFA